MGARSVKLPKGFRIAHFETIDSTNSEAMRRAHNGEASGLWIWAETQSAGRGRSGRSWESARGNLFASLLLRPTCPVETVLQLSFVAGIALHEAVTKVASADQSRALALKWPNDLLLEEKKIGGILIESFDSGTGKGSAVVIGSGLNVTSHPGKALYPATNLSAHGLIATPADVLGGLVAAMAEWLDIWDQGEGFAQIREAWLARAVQIGRPVRIRLGDNEISGVFGGIDEKGSMRLIDDDGAEKRIRAGDVFLAS